MKPKVVFDTNIYISGIIFGGNPRTCMELAREKEVELVTSSDILLEIAKKLKDKFKWTNQEIQEVIEGISKFANIVKPKKRLSVIKADPSDNKILECAQELKANYIVSGDIKHVLAIEKFKGIKIVSAKNFLDIFYQKTK
ncbi:MAG: hypothetical protein UU23_C0004G0058 [Candidatus Curtissbacteria bacterium GW2011_GWA1_40_9]|uniref:PIN domain-containing protein n=1 Tax=Candidatus Curtissbacteria bacterium GW2011_GWA1_40_9 TaxID=1618408 RepID=A0A0G0TT91_9BACT|nr:MAG: hypothetical protein UU23_C0004G0058 [Candidatus Curtissbacteria bacterium GW2011_GWA1_40_9]